MTAAPAIRVAVAAHRPYRMPDDPMYLPVRVGAALGPCPEGMEAFQPDDEGESISARNPSYSELTALYWVWKNCDAGYKGLVHYRRLLGSPDAKKRRAADPYGRLAAAGELLPLLEGQGVVVAKRRRYCIETVYSHYAHTFDARQFDACREVLSETRPECVAPWDALMRSRGAHVFNMFVMRADLLDAYCEYLFDVLAGLEEKVDPSGMTAFEARWPGRVSERLLDPWLEANGIVPAELPVVSPEPVDWVSKGRGFLAAKFLGRKYERSF
ncbi:MAG: DUF4422 domain-containing protein [Eggerthellaceae bacterium]|nr:DUF4422 domain-containing protein [Eggerthellaceae bacterium]